MNTHILSPTYHSPPEGESAKQGRLRPQLSRWGVTAVATVAMLCLFSGCSLNPATGNVNLVLMSESREKEVGEEEHQKILEGVTLVQDKNLSDYVDEVGQRMAAVSHRPDLEYQFFVIDSPDINAFALPGGYVYVNRGLLAYLNSEAELAAVLGHEIGHITARHAVQRDAQGRLRSGVAQVVGFGAAVLTGSGYIGSQIAEVGSIWAQMGLSGFGREQELEADSLGAEYLLEAGYAPQAMLEVITTLKNQGDFRRRVSGTAGGYHGLFASHPRNDSRLQQAVISVGQLPPGKALAPDHAVFRDAIAGLEVGGAPGTPRVQDERNRYYQTLLGYTMVFPDDWNIEETTTTVEARSDASPAPAQGQKESEEDSEEDQVQIQGSLRVEAQRIQRNIEPRLFIRDVLGIADLQQSQPLEQYRLLGHTGITRDEATGKPMRVAAIYFGPRVFIFRGLADAPEGTEEADATDDRLLGAIRSFRAIQRGELAAASGHRIKWAQASGQFDFAVVAQDSPLPDYPEETLRLLNGHYPRGQPEAGEWVKLVE